MSNKDNKPCRSLREIEAQVEAEMREFGRRRLEEELQKEADLHGQIFPHSLRRAQHSRRKAMHLKSVAGTIKLIVWHGYDPGSHRWGCPIRQQWGLTPHQQLSPALEDK